MKRVWVFALILALGCASIPAEAHAQNNIGLIARGVSKILGAAFQVPAHMLAGSTRYFPFGLLTGAMSGTFHTLGGVLGGGFDVARGAAPYAKYLVFL